VLQELLGDLFIHDSRLDMGEHHTLCACER
jgi:hypothetical protein